MKSKLERLLLTARQVYAEKLRHKPVEKTNAYNNYVDELNNSGVTFIENYYTRAQCEAIIADIEKGFVDYKEYLWTDDEGADRRIHGSEKAAESIMGFHSDPMMLSIANDFNGTATMCFSTLAGKITEAVDNKGSGGGWHRDTAMETKQFKAILYLTDVTMENGPFQYLVGTHKAGSLYNSILKANIDYAQNRLTDEEVEKIKRIGSYELRTYTAKAGTVLLANTFGIHRGMPLVKGQRYALTNYYCPVSFWEKNEASIIKKFNKINRD